MKYMGRLDNETVLVAMSNDEYERAERFLKLDPERARATNGRAGYFVITGIDRRRKLVSYTIYERDAEAALQIMHKMKGFCENVYCSYPS